MNRYALMPFGCLNSSYTATPSTSPRAYPYPRCENLKLTDYLDQWHGQRGIDKIITLAAIRTYVSKKSVRVLIDEINAINTIEDLNVLIGAGMKGALHTAVMGRKAQLTPF
jgi:hypothetical protein